MSWLRSRRNKQIKPVISGSLLLADYSMAMNNLFTAETAKYVAKKSEEETMQTINSAAPVSTAYIKANDLSDDAKYNLMRSSVNAHLQKAQSEQISDYTYNQLAEMEIKDKQNYIGRKIRVTIKDKKYKPVESFWQNSRTGETRQGTLSAKSITGSIEDIVLEKNALILKPSLSSRLLMPERKNLIIYVINPETLQPAVELSII